LRPEIGLEQMCITGDDHVPAPGPGESDEVVVARVAWHHALGGRILDERCAGLYERNCCSCCRRRPAQRPSCRRQQMSATLAVDELG